MLLARNKIIIKLIIIIQYETKLRVMEIIIMSMRSSSNVVCRVPWIVNVHHLFHKNQKPKNKGSSIRLRDVDDRI